MDTVDDDIAAVAEPLEEAKKKANKLQSGQSRARSDLTRSCLRKVTDDILICGRAHVEVNALKATLTNKELTAKIAELNKSVSAVNILPVLLFGAEAELSPFVRRTERDSPRAPRPSSIWSEAHLARGAPGGRERVEEGASRVGREEEGLLGVSRIRLNACSFRPAGLER